MKHLKYLILELGWFLPVIIAQWLFGPAILKSKWKAMPLVALPLAVYLTAKDKVALDEGTWSVNPDTSTGVMIGGVPVEEAIFFLLTSIVSAQGIILFTDEGSFEAWSKVRSLLKRRNPLPRH